MENSEEQVIIERIQSVEDFSECFDVISEAFGRQAGDEIWIGMNPRWDTPEGKERGAARLAKQFLATNVNLEGKPNTLFLKATVPDPRADDGRVIAGMAIWAQLSDVEGYGDPPASDLRRYENVNEVCPDDEKQRRFIFQMLSSLHKRRDEVVREKSTAHPPAILQLDLCVVDPSFQRRGIAGKLVQFGIDEAKQRGGIECITQASSMGRGAYMKLGFLAEEEDIVYEVDTEFLSRKMPPNVFMRTDHS